MVNQLGSGKTSGFSRCRTRCSPGCKGDEIGVVDIAGAERFEVVNIAAGTEKKGSLQVRVSRIDSWCPAGLAVGRGLSSGDRDIFRHSWRFSLPPLPAGRYQACQPGGPDRSGHRPVPPAPLLFVPEAGCKLSSWVSHWKCSASSATSTLRAMARFLGE